MKYEKPVLSRISFKIKESSLAVCKTYVDEIEGSQVTIACQWDTGYEPGTPCYDKGS